MISAGGPVAWILLGLAAVAVVMYFERLLDLRRAHIDIRDFLDGVINVLDSGNDDEALAICDDVTAPAGRIVATAIRHRAAPARVLREAVDASGRAEAGRLDRRLAVLAIIAQIAPVTGLFGTVVGFLRAVLLVNSAEIVTRTQLLSASMEALVAAAMGLAVAVPVTVMYDLLRVRLERIVVELEGVDVEAFCCGFA